MALGLAYYQKLPKVLINYIFSSEFLEQIDLEIRYCFSKVSKLNKSFTFWSYR